MVPATHYTSWSGKLYTQIHIFDVYLNFRSKPGLVPHKKGIVSINRALQRTWFTSRRLFSANVVECGQQSLDIFAVTLSRSLCIQRISSINWPRKFHQARLDLLIVDWLKLATPLYGWRPTAKCKFLPILLRRSDPTQLKVVAQTGIGSIGSGRYELALKQYCLWPLNTRFALWPRWRDSSQSTL